MIFLVMSYLIKSIHEVMRHKKLPKKSPYLISSIQLRRFGCNSFVFHNVNAFSLPYKTAIDGGAISKSIPKRYAYMYYI